MVSEERPDRQEEGQELVPTDSQDVPSVEVGEPTAPQGFSEEEQEELRKRAKELVLELSNAEGAKERELIDNVANVGTQAQKSSGAELDLLRQRVRDMFSQEGAGNEIAASLVDLRMTLNEINPAEVSKPSRLRSVPSGLRNADKNLKNSMRLINVNGYVPTTAQYSAYFNSSTDVRCCSRINEEFLVNNSLDKAEIALYVLITIMMIYNIIK